tara:strand:+ start:783 stop:1043 length:261 start_codon:yes stop_codon:yes gene_type:complete
MAKEKQKSITVDEKIVDKLRELRKEQQQAQLNIGMLEAQKFELTANLLGKGQEMRTIMLDLEKKHGKGSLNLDTGKLELDANESNS